MPLDINDGVKGDTLLEVELRIDDDRLRDYEWIEEGKPYRECLAPAAVINEALARVSIVADEEEAIHVARRQSN